MCKFFFAVYLYFFCFMERMLIIQELERNKICFQALFTAYSDTSDFIRWKPQSDKWSLLEILCHLVDEEREDFRTRLQFALSQSAGDPPSIDPQGWVKSRNYLDQIYSEKCKEFISERNQSIEWLNSLENYNEHSFFTHSKFGIMTSHYILHNWLAHDYLHLKQITKLRYDFLSQSGIQLDYAGNWS
jgi:hypothetical protein